MLVRFIALFLLFSNLLVISYTNTFSAETPQLEKVESLFVFGKELPDRFTRTPVSKRIDERNRIDGIVFFDDENSDVLQVTRQSGIDQTSKAERRVFMYAVVNGAARSFMMRGATRNRVVPSDLEALDLSKPIEVRVDLTQADGTPLYMMIRMFFTKHGYSVAAWSEDKKRLERIVPIMRAVADNPNP